MHVPVPRPEPFEVLESRPTDGFSALAQALAARGELTLVYAPSMTTITNTAPRAHAPTRTATMRPRYTLGEVIACSGLTLAGGGILSILVTALLQVPEFVPVLGGSTGLVGMLTAVVGLALDDRERNGSMR